jgi:hypothetical protein
LKNIFNCHGSQGRTYEIHSQSGSKLLLSHMER